MTGHDCGHQTLADCLAATYAEITKGTSMTHDDRGVLHRHADGTQHQHFAAGFEIGGQVIEDQDGREEHTHGILGNPAVTSGPVVWYRTIPGTVETVTLTYDPKVADPNPVDGSNVHVGTIVAKYSTGDFDFEPSYGGQAWTVLASEIDRGDVAVDPKQVG